MEGDLIMLKSKVLPGIKYKYNNDGTAMQIVTTVKPDLVTDTGEPIYEVVETILTKEQVDEIKKKYSFKWKK